MIPQYLNPLCFVDKPNETGATFILTNPKESKTLEPGTPVTIWRYSRGLLDTGQNPRRDNQGGLHHRSLR